MTERHLGHSCDQQTGARSSRGETQHPHESLVTQQMSVHVSRPHTTHYCVTFPGEMQTNVYSPQIRGTDLIGQRTNFT